MSYGTSHVLARLIRYISRSFRVKKNWRRSRLRLFTIGVPYGSRRVGQLIFQFDKTNFDGEPHKARDIVNL